MEISHYVHQEPSLSDYELLVVQGELDNVLDLTQIGNIQNVAKEMGYSGNNFMVLSDLKGFWSVTTETCRSRFWT
jgi:hypothetical protein